jgi:heme exporter protein A
VITLTADRLTVNRADESVFADVSFTLTSGEGMAVTGPNGAGKSTLMRALAGLLPWADGSVRVSGLCGEETLRSSMHFITALNAMKPALTVAENLAFWQAMGGKDWHDTRAALDLFGIGRVHDVPFSDLSTGQKRRVSLARLFLNRKPVWMLDEPTSGLDAATETLFAEMLSDHVGDGGLFIAATHLPLGKAAGKTLRFEEG